MAQRPAGYVPAASHDLFLPLYDPVLRWLMRERAFKTRLVEQANIAAGQQVLDLGCGTGTLTLLAKRLQPRADLVGVDGDPKVLAIARRKAAAAGLPIRFDEALATHLPYADRDFDRVLCSLVLHHLTRAEKLEALTEVRRVLRPGGSLHVIDFGPPAGWLGRQVRRVVGAGERLADNLEGRLPEILRAAGLVRVEERGQHGLAFATLAFLSASKPEDGAAIRA